ncbi:molybdenum cofactor sulfurase 3 [Atheta coriaria]|uniref:molybdenum cofactor sulfurase 3 n=1 Tax=Dalotia coriaria TaxID=877792 RepID=UPI0031F3C670
MSTDYTPIYSKELEKSLEEEFKDILKDNIYLDHAGATLYSKTQISDVHSELSKNLFANPHSKSTVSKSTEDIIDSIRYQILDFFGTSPQEYSVIFTSGATAALKLVAETFDYQDGRLVYLEENHTSVLGMREYAKQSTSLTKKQLFDVFTDKKSMKHQVNGNTQIQNGDNDDDNVNGDIYEYESNNLFVYPAQCNFSGFKYPLEWIKKTHGGYLNTNNNTKTTKTEKWYCLLDAASYASTNPLDLNKTQADFVCVSFYKIFGYPTGLGALLVKNSSADLLKKKYYGGGTVFMALASKNTVVHRSNLQEKFEDGTISFLSIASLRHGFAALKRHNLQISTIQAHVFNLAQYVYNNLKNYKHYNNQPVCVLYHDGEFKQMDQQGGIVNFNILRADGSYIGFAEVMHIANLYNISLRTGCFCNPGACQRHLGISTEEVLYYYEMGHVCGDQRDLIDGKPTGSVRISFGYMSNKKDADAILHMIKSSFLQTFSHENNLNNTIDVDLSKANFGKLEKIYIYPIKSCAALEVTHEWNLVSTGLQYDREWMIVNQDGMCLTQKHETRMCMIQSEINLQTKQLILSFNSKSKNHKNTEKETISVDLDLNFDNYRCHSKVCGDKIQGFDCGDEVAYWLDAMLNREGLRLIKQFDRNAKHQEIKLSLVNQAQFLLINKASVEWLYKRVPDVPDEENTEKKELLINSIARFRPNLLIDFGTPFIENNFKEVYIENLKFLVQGKCTRCQMICIDQSSGKKTVEPLRTLSRELQGKITFGIYLQMEQNRQSRCAIAPAMRTTAINADSH